MKTSRRNFLKGTVIGLVAGVPFVAAFGAQPKGGLYDFVMSFVTTHGEEIWSPNVEEIVHKTGQIVFTAQPIDLYATMTLKGMKVYLPDGRLLKGEDFKWTVPVCNGDTVKLTYTLSYEEGPKVTEKMPNPEDWQSWSQKIFDHRDRQAQYRKEVDDLIERCKAQNRRNQRFIA